VRHHARFYGAGLLGALVFASSAALPSVLRLVVSGDVSFAAYLASTVVFALGATPGVLRRRASAEDEGVTVIILLTLAAVSLCLAALFALLRLPGPPEPVSLLFSILSVLLGWFTVHTVAAFRYAHLYYAPDELGDDRDAGGLEFPGKQDPDVWDFFYYAFVVGMTAQVSDIQVSGAMMRRTTLAHGVISFFFNTVILALAVNIAASNVH